MTASVEKAAPAYPVTIYPVTMIKTGAVVESPTNPRRTFREDEIQELAEDLAAVLAWKVEVEEDQVGCRGVLVHGLLAQVGHGGFAVADDEEIVGDPALT